jgi:hypothetical protein
MYILIKEIKDADPKSNFHVETVQPFDYTIKYIYSADYRFDKNTSGDYPY